MAVQNRAWAACVLAASLLWGTTGTAATFAPAVGPLAIGAAAMGSVFGLGERLPIAGWAGVGLIAGCLAVLTVGGRAILPSFYVVAGRRYRGWFDGRHIITCLSRYGREVGSARL